MGKKLDLNLKKEKAAAAPPPQPPSTLRAWSRRACMGEGGKREDWRRKKAIFSWGRFVWKDKKDKTEKIKTKKPPYLIAALARLFKIN